MWVRSSVFWAATARLLNGVIEPTSGSMRLLGLDPQVDGPALRSRTGVLTETPSLDERLSAWDKPKRSSTASYSTCYPKGSSYLPDFCLHWFAFWLYNGDRPTCRKVVLT
jgi:hypothetical protein